VSVRLVVPAVRTGAISVALGGPEGHWATFLSKRTSFGGQQGPEAPQCLVAGQKDRDFARISEVVPDKTEERVDGFIDPLRFAPERFEGEKAAAKVGPEIGHVPDAIGHPSGHDENAEDLASRGEGSLDVS